MTEVAARSHWRRWWPWLGGLVGLAALAWVLRRFDLDSFRVVLAGADVRFLLLVPLAIAGEQLVRAWKWRQLLYPLRSVGTLHLFGAIMAGYLAGLLIPFGFGALARAWLVARRAIGSGGFTLHDWRLPWVSRAVQPHFPLSPC